MSMRTSSGGITPAAFSPEAAGAWTTRAVVGPCAERFRAGNQVPMTSFNFGLLTAVFGDQTKPPRC